MFLHDDDVDVNELASERESEQAFVAFVGECSDFYLGQARSFASVAAQRSSSRAAIAIGGCLGAHLFENNYEQQNQKNKKKNEKNKMRGPLAADIPLVRLLYAFIYYNIFIFVVPFFTSI